MQKTSYEDKCKVVSMVLDDGYSYLKAGRTIGVSKTTVMGWVKIVKEHGYAKLETPKRSYSGEFKLSVLKYMKENHCSSHEASAHFNVSRSQIQRWEKKYYEKGEGALMEDGRGRSSKIRKPRTPVDLNQDLLKELEYLRMENEYLKKLNALVQKKENQSYTKKSKSSEN